MRNLLERSNWIFVEESGNYLRVHCEKNNNKREERKNYIKYDFF